MNGSFSDPQFTKGANPQPKVAPRPNGETAPDPVQSFGAKFTAEQLRQAGIDPATHWQRAKEMAAKEKAARQAAGKNTGGATPGQAAGIQNSGGGSSATQSSSGTIPNQASGAQNSKSAGTQSSGGSNSATGKTQSTSVAADPVDTPNNDIPDTTDFPLHCLPQRLMVEAVAESVDVHPNLPALISMGIVSGSLGRGLEMRSGPDQVLRGNTFIVASAISGDGKTVTANQLDFPLKQYAKSKLVYWLEFEKPKTTARKARLEKEAQSILSKLYGAKSSLLSDHEKKKLGDRLETIYAQLDKLKADSEEPTLWTEDATQESLVKLMYYNQEQLFSYSTDAKKAVQNLFGLYNRLKSPEDNFFVKSFSGDPFRSDRMGREKFYLESPCLSMFWLVQPELHKEMLGNQWLHDGGFLPRILPGDSRLEPQEDDGKRKAIPLHIREGWEIKITELLTYYREHPKPEQIPDTNSNAESIFRAYKNSLVAQRRGKNRDINSYVARWAEHAQRIAIGLHAIANGKRAHIQPITDDTINSAIEIMKWFAGEQLRTLAAGRHDSLKARRGKLRILLMNDYKNGGVSLRHLRKNHGWDDRDVEHLAAAFPSEFEIFEKKNPKGAPASKCVKLKK
jgi:hypothetical protein